MVYQPIENYGIVGDISSRFATRTYPGGSREGDLPVIRCMKHRKRGEAPRDDITPLFVPSSRRTILVIWGSNCNRT
jgi:hypothetical protein